MHYVLVPGFGAGGRDFSIYRTRFPSFDIVDLSFSDTFEAQLEQLDRALNRSPFGQSVLIGVSWDGLVLMAWTYPLKNMGR